MAMSSSQGRAGKCRMQSAECRIAPIGRADRKVIPAPFLLEALFTLAPLKGELAFAKQKTEGFIFLTFISYFAFPRVTLEPLGLLLCPERQSKQNALFIRKSEGASHSFQFSCFSIKVTLFI